MIYRSRYMRKGEKERRVGHGTMIGHGSFLLWDLRIHVWHIAIGFIHHLSVALGGCGVTL